MHKKEEFAISDAQRVVMTSLRSHLCRANLINPGIGLRRQQTIGNKKHYWNFAIKESTKIKKSNSFFRFEENLSDISQRNSLNAISKEK